MKMVLCAHLDTNIGFRHIQSLKCTIMSLLDI